MRSRNLVTKRLPRAVFAGLINAISMAGAAQAEIAPQLPDGPAENQMTLVLETAPAMSGAGRSVTGARVGHQAMVYRFRVQARDGKSTAPRSTNAWEITVYAASGVAGPHRSLARLTSHRPDMTLPRPYGYAFTQADSVVVVVRILDAEAASAVLTLTIDYEPISAAHRRWAVLPHPATGVTTTSEFVGVAAGEAHTYAWEWTPSVSGRIVAVAGAQFAEAWEIVLTDAETGEVLRRVAHAGRAQSGVASGGGEFVRGITTSVQAGHTYRLIAYYGEAGPDAARAAASLVHAILLPVLETP